MKYPRICRFLLLLSFLAAGCAGGPRLAVRESGAPLVLLEPLALRDLMPLDDFGAYEKNLFIGRIRYSGGIIQDRDAGNTYRSKHIEVSLEDYPERISAKLQDAIIGALRDKNIAFVQKPLPPAPEAAGPPVIIEAVQAPPPDDAFLRRTDNIHFPCLDYLLSPARDTAAWLAPYRAEGNMALVPVIECGYSHSAGWFYDRESGSAAGVRIIFQLVAVDISTGEIRYRFKYDFKDIPGRNSYISEYVVTDILNKFAGEVKKALSKSIR
jgi:hypothetical protein